VLIVGILVPILEEIIYRVLPINKMVPRVSPVVAVILTSIFFGISHGQIIWMIYTIPFGILLATMFLKYKSSIANITIHSAFNITSLILTSLPIETSVEDETKLAIIVLAIGIAILILSGILLKKTHKKENEVLEN